MASAPLQVLVEAPDTRLGTDVSEHIERGVERLDTWTRQFPERRCRIRIGVLGRDSHAVVHLVLSLPNKVIVAEGSAPRQKTAVDEAFRKVSRQLREFKSVLRKDHLHQQTRELVQHAAELREEELPSAVRRRDREVFAREAGEQASRLARFFWRESRALGAAGDLSVDDLIEETLVQALQDFDRKPHELATHTWLFAKASEVLEQAGHTPHEEPVDLAEEDLVPPPPSAEEDLYDGLHRLLFRGETDDDLPPAPPNRVRIRAPAPSDPAEEAEEADLRERLDGWLSELPALCRRAFLLHFIEGFELQDIAQMQGISEVRVRSNIRSSERFLRERLRSAGAE